METGIGLSNLRVENADLHVDQKDKSDKVEIDQYCTNRADLFEKGVGLVGEKDRQLYAVVDEVEPKYVGHSQKIAKDYLLINQVPKRSPFLGRILFDQHPRNPKHQQQQRRDGHASHDEHPRRLKFSSQYIQRGIMRVPR